MGIVRKHNGISLDASHRLYIDGVRSNFWITELVSKKTFLNHGFNSIYFVDYEALLMLQKIRGFFGKPMTVNDGWSGGHLNQRGYRSDLTTVGAKNSQHRYRLAYDFSMKSLSADKIREAILANQPFFYKIGVRRIEHGDYAPTWCHVDMKDTQLHNAIYVFKPRRTTQISQEERWSI